MKTFIDLWKNTFNFKGTVTTSEFFKSILVNFVFMFIAFIPFAVIYAAVLMMMVSNGADFDSESLMQFNITLAFGYYAVLCLPFLSLLVRRIRDSKVSIPMGLILAFVMPVIGFIYMGVANKVERKNGIVSKIGYTLFVCGIGSALWLTIISFIVMNPVLFENYAVYGLGAMVAGIIVSYIGTKIDEKNNA